jgi:hypothetical protein
MRLLCIHAETVTALQRLHTPFDDLTPAGLWSTPYHLVGVSREQCDVLRTFNVDFEDVTPAGIDHAQPSLTESLSYATPARVHNGLRLRTSLRGAYLEATVDNGRILIGGRAYDSPAAASRGITTDQSEWAFWEYLDDTSGQWQLLSREWHVESRATPAPAPSLAAPLRSADRAQATSAH